MTTIKRCTCKHKAQDTFHGKGMRVHNYTKDGDSRCTVCGNISTSKRWKVLNDETS